MAHRVAATAEAAGAEVRVRHIAETRDPASFAQQPGLDGELRGHQRPAAGHRGRHRVGRCGHLRHTHPIRFSRFTIPHLLRRPGRSVGDRASWPTRCMRAFTSSQTEHGGQETTLLALYISLMHFGGIIVPPGYTDGVKFVDGNPYGVSHVTGPENKNELSDATTGGAGPPCATGGFGHRPVDRLLLQILRSHLDQRATLALPVDGLVDDHLRQHHAAQRRPDHLGHIAIGGIVGDQPAQAADRVVHLQQVLRDDCRPGRRGWPAGSRTPPSTSGCCSSSTRCRRRSRCALAAAGR